MSEKYVTLMGAEAVQSAGNAMRGAAESMNSAASNMSYAFESHQRFLDNWLERLEEVMKPESEMTITDASVMNTRDYLATSGLNANTVVSRAVADAVMLDSGGTTMSRGHLYEIVCQQVSPGTCRLTLKRND